MSRVIFLTFLLIFSQNLFAQDSLNNALLEASWENNLAKVKELIASGADVNAKSYEGAAPLHFACIHNNLKMLQTLIDHNADLNIQDQHKKTPLILCAEFGLDTLAEELILHDANTNLKNISGKDALYIATENGDFIFTDMLLYYGANPRTFSNDSSGLTHAAVQSGNTDVLHLVLENKVSPNRLNIYGNTPMHYAFLQNYTNMIKILMEYGGVYRSGSAKNKDMLHLSLHRSNISMVHFLIRNDYTSSFKPLENYYNDAIRQDHKDIIQIFKQKNIKRNLKPVVQGISIESNLFANLKDHSFGISAGIREMKSNIFVHIGYTHRLWAKRVLYTYFNKKLQLWERRGNTYISLSKGIRLMHKDQKSLFFQIGGMAFYTWGKYNGMSKRIKASANITPTAGLQYIINQFSLSMSYSYLNYSNNLPKTFMLLRCGWTIPFKP